MTKQQTAAARTTEQM